MNRRILAAGATPGSIVAVFVAPSPAPPSGEPAGTIRPLVPTL